MDWKASLESLKEAMPDEPDTAPADAAEIVPADVSVPFPEEKARLDIMLDKKGRKGKAATIIAGFTVDDPTVEEISRRLKQRLATGGSARGGEILIQGDKRQQVEAALKALGLKCRII